MRSVSLCVFWSLFSNQVSCLNVSKLFGSVRYKTISKPTGPKLAYRNQKADKNSPKASMLNIIVLHGAIMRDNCQKPHRFVLKFQGVSWKLNTDKTVGECDRPKEFEETNYFSPKRSGSLCQSKYGGRVQDITTNPYNMWRGISPLWRKETENLRAAKCINLCCLFTFSWNLEYLYTFLRTWCVLFFIGVFVLSGFHVSFHISSAFYRLLSFRANGVRRNLTGATRKLGEHEKILQTLRRERGSQNANFLC